MDTLLKRWKENGLIVLMAKTVVIITVCFEDRVNVCMEDGSEKEKVLSDIVSDSALSITD